MQHLLADQFCRLPADRCDVLLERLAMHCHGLRDAVAGLHKAGGEGIAAGRHRVGDRVPVSSIRCEISLPRMPRSMIRASPVAFSVEETSSPRCPSADTRPSPVVLSACVTLSALTSRRALTACPMPSIRDAASALV